jgi:hypothetical protein
VAIKELRGLGKASRIPPITQVLKRLKKLDLTMPELRAPARRPWAEGAASLAKTYLETVNPGAGWSRNGPAVRFLELALNRAYPGSNVTRAAIATELWGDFTKRRRDRAIAGREAAIAEERRLAAVDQARADALIRGLAAAYAITRAGQPAAQPQPTFTTCTQQGVFTNCVQQ